MNMECKKCRSRIRKTRNPCRHQGAIIQWVKFHPSMYSLPFDSCFRIRGTQKYIHYITPCQLMITQADM